MRDFIILKQVDSLFPGAVIRRKEVTLVPPAFRNTGSNNDMDRRGNPRGPWTLLVHIPTRRKRRGTLHLSSGALCPLKAGLGSNRSSSTSEGSDSIRGYDDEYGLLIRDPTLLPQAKTELRVSDAIVLAIFLDVHQHHLIHDNWSCASLR